MRLDPSPSMLSSQCCQGTPSHYKNYSTSQPLFNASQRLIGRKHVSGSRRSRSAGGDTDSSSPPSSSPTDWRRISYYQERSPDELHALASFSFHCRDLYGLFCIPMNIVARVGQPSNFPPGHLFLSFSPLPTEEAEELRVTRPPLLESFPSFPLQWNPRRQPHLKLLHTPSRQQTDWGHLFTEAAAAQ